MRTRDSLGGADSVALRRFLGLELYDSTRDHTTISLRRRLIDMETHRTVFDWVLKMSADEGLLKNNRMSMEARTLEANAPIPRSRTVRAASRKTSFRRNSPTRAELKR